jgi:hypothetical protein
MLARLDQATEPRHLDFAGLAAAPTERCPCLLLEYHRQRHWRSFSASSKAMRSMLMPDYRSTMGTPQ